MHLPTALQISCSITSGLGEKGKLHTASDVQSRSITVNGILQICVCMYLLCLCVDVHVGRERTAALVCVFSLCV